MTRTEYRRYYYTSQKSFEQSLDVYKPIEEKEGESSEDRPLVVLVVGSAWLGHRSIIYTGTSWWNSSGPKAFAKQGCVTVCIRHRGSFPRIHGPLVLPVSCLVAAFLAAMYKFPDRWHSNGGTLVASIGAILVAWVLLALGCRGAADFDIMVRDVADALCWVHRHKDSDILQKKRFHSTSFTEEKKDGNERASRAVIFGGYSSGGHVAATLMQRPHLFTAKGLPAPDEFCDAALFISGVLAVRPPANDNTIHSTWCTDLVTQVVFGKTGASKLPSPLHGVHKQPKVPHLLIGCENEVFGLKWMDVFFCSRAFCESLNQRNVPAKLVEIQSDHWNILESASLSHALKTELRWIMNKALEYK